MTWYYKGEEFENAPENCIGFVYLITNNLTNKKYIGKKFFWSDRRIKQKGKLRRKLVRKESDWRNYFGSNRQLLTDIENQGNVDIKREILRLCETKGECSYYEAKEQFDRNVLLDESYYNEFIGCKINGSHLRKNTNII